MPILESMIGFIKIASLTRFGTKGDFDAVTKENIKSKGAVVCSVGTTAVTWSADQYKGFGTAHWV